MDVKDLLTNEKLTKRFSSLFELVNYSIRIAEELIKSGRDPRVRTDIQNPMYRVLLEILNDKDQAVSLEQIIEAREKVRQRNENPRERHSD
ncbi:MAG: hypothetical protein Q8K75_08630 [Chlamydiales bacterium]|nr:hypothetical protein [Chlamydiales bacterium]